MRQAHRRGSWRTTLHTIAAVVLGGWIAGLVVAAIQLDAWNDELARTLLQIRADAVFRTRMVEAGQPIPREWYRSKALALLAASEKLRDDTTWALFVPGAWQRFDDLRPRVAARIERAFSETAVETVRRELYFQASRLTGVPQDPQTAELVAAGGCAPPALSGAAVGSDRPAGAARAPELAAIEDQLDAIEELDRAVQAMLALQSSSGADPENLRLVVRYTLGVELPGQLSRSAAFFRTVMQPEGVGFAGVGVPRLKQAARCSVAVWMKALDTRLFERDGLLAAEASLAQRAARLFAPGARPGSFAQTVRDYREMVAGLNEQEALLASGDYAWLREASTSLGPTHDRLLARVARIGLLGPEAVEQARRQSAGAVQRFKRQFGLVFGAAGEAALVWQPERRRLVLSPQRLALRDGLTALLREPYMAPPADRVLPAAARAPLAWDTQRLEQALALADAHRRFTREMLPMFPPVLRRSIAQFVQEHLAQLVQDATVEAMSPAPASGTTLFDPAGYRLQRDYLWKVQSLLADLGARARADKVRALLSGDLVERLAIAEAGMWRSSVYSERLQHFGWWQGNGSPIQQAFGVADHTTLRYLLAQQFSRLDEFGREAGFLLAYADASIASHPVVQRWQGTVADLKRYRAGAADSSLAALERYLLTLGANLDRSNCLEKLAAMTPAPRPDEFARRHGQIHAALVSRCAELRLRGTPAPPSAWTIQPLREVTPHG